MNYHPEKVARIAGFLFVLMAPIGFFGMMYVQSQLVDMDMNKTITRIIDSEFYFRLSMVSTFLMNLDMIALVISLNFLLKSINKSMATLMAILGFIGVGISMLSELNHFLVLSVATSSKMSVFNQNQLEYLVKLFLDARYFGSFGIAQIFWSLWLFPLGYLVIKSQFIPKALGILLIVAGLAYFTKCILLFLFPAYHLNLLDFLTIGEIIFGLWLLFKGIDPKKWEMTQTSFLDNNFLNLG